MFIKATKYTINTDRIVYSEDFPNGTTSIYFVDGKQLSLDEEDARALWGMLQRQTMPHVWAKENPHME